MRSTRHKIPPINSSSSADIAFLLLIFFLITSSMDPQTGIYRQMNELPTEEVLKNRMEITERNLLTIAIDSGNQLRVNDETIYLRDVKELAKTFIANPDDQDYLPEKETIDIPIVGPYPVTAKHVVRLEFDPLATYNAYLLVLNEVSAAYNELRSAAAQQLFDTDFEQLNAEQKEALRAIYPMQLAEEILTKEGKEGMP